MDRQRTTQLYVLGDALASSMEALVAKAYAWMWGISLSLSLAWFFMPTESFADLQRPLLMGSCGILLTCSLAWVSGVVVRCLCSPSAKS